MMSQSKKLRMANSIQPTKHTTAKMIHPTTNR